MLTAKEQRFVSEYLVDGNGSQAAIRSGYAANSARVTASRLLKKLTITDAIANIRATFGRDAQPKEIAAIADASERRVLLSKMLRDVDAHPLARLKAADILNRMDALYVQKVDVTHHTKPDLSKLSDAELLQLETLVGKAAPLETRH